MRVIEDGRVEVSPDELNDLVDIRYDVRKCSVANMYKKLIVPSYVHGYSLAIEYYYNWFREKFDHDYFRGGIYIDSKHVLDEYKQPCKTLVKKESPKARIIPTLDTDYDREDVDVYQAPPELFLRRSSFEDSFFKDYDRNIFLSMRMRGMRMNFNTKVRVNTRAQQLDLLSRMELYFRIGASETHFISVDYHVPKTIILSIAARAGFDIKDGEVQDIISFLNYFNNHSDLCLYFKIRAINQKPEFFVRVHNVYVHIMSRDKLSKDDGETDGKLQFNYNVEMENVLTTSIPHFYVLHSEQDIRSVYPGANNYVERELDSTVAIYSINVYEPPHTDENGWNEAAITYYSLDPNEVDMDLSSIFTGENPMCRTIKHDLSLGISPSHFIDIKIFTDEDVAKSIPYDIDWNTKIITLKVPYVRDLSSERVYQIAIYYDRNYIYNLETTVNNFNGNRYADDFHGSNIN